MDPTDFAPDEPVSRRRTLAALGVGAGTGLVGTVLLPDATESPDVEHTPAHETNREMEPVSENETPYAVWQYRGTRDGGFTTTLPINVVSPLERATFDELIGVFESAGWVSYPAEYSRYAWDREIESYVHSQWSGAETHFGTAGRLHVRCWDLAGRASIQAHTDTPPMPGHQIRSYAEGRAAVESLFDAAGWRVAAYVDLRNERGDHDGRASILEAPG